MSGKSLGTPPLVLKSSGSPDPEAACQPAAITKQRTGTLAPWLGSLSNRAATHDVVSGLWLLFRGRQMLRIDFLEVPDQISLWCFTKQAVAFRFIPGILLG